MSEPRSASVVIPVRNGASTIANALQSLAAQNLGGMDVQRIVVDNDSTDETVAIVRGFDVTLLHEPVRGAAAARNCGLRAALGDIVAFCDADTVLTRGWLADLIEAFRDPAVTLVAGRIVCYPPKTPAERYLANCGVYDVERAVSRDPFPFAPSGNMAVRRAQALAIGGFDEEMLTAEDADFAFRLLEAFPGTIAYRPNAMLLHCSRSSTEELRRQAFVYGEGVARMYRRYPHILRWNSGKAFHVAMLVAGRALAPYGLYARRAVGDVPSEAIEFSTYHRLWTWWFWRGFFHLYYRRDGLSARR